jgi:hypothetical protein
MQAVPVLYFRFAQIMEQRFPSLYLREKIRGRLGHQNVPGIPTIHHPLRNVDAATGHVTVRVDVRNAVHRSRVNAHAQLHFGMIAETAAYVDGAASGSFGIAKEHQRHSIASGQADELIVFLRARKFSAVTYRVLESVQDALLLLHAQSGVAHYVHEQDIRHLERRRMARLAVVLRVHELTDPPVSYVKSTTEANKGQFRPQS